MFYLFERENKFTSEIQWWQVDLHNKCKLLYQSQDLWGIADVFLQLRNQKWYFAHLC